MKSFWNAICFGNAPKNVEKVIKWENRIDLTDATSPIRMHSHAFCTQYARASTHSVCRIKIETAGNAQSKQILLMFVSVPHTRSLGSFSIRQNQKAIVLIITFIPVDLKTEYHQDHTKHYTAINKMRMWSAGKHVSHKNYESESMKHTSGRQSKLQSLA